MLRPSLGTYITKHLGDASHRQLGEYFPMGGLMPHIAA